MIRRIPFHTDMHNIQSYIIKIYVWIHWIKWIMCYFAHFFSCTTLLGNLSLNWTWTEHNSLNRILLDLVDWCDVCPFVSLKKIIRKLYVKEKNNIYDKGFPFFSTCLLAWVCVWDWEPHKKYIMARQTRNICILWLFLRRHLFIPFSVQNCNSLFAICVNGTNLRDHCCIAYACKVTSLKEKRVKKCCTFLHTSLLCSYIYPFFQLFSLIGSLIDS